MINNRVVTITKKTHFDKPWTLFTPEKLSRCVNSKYRNISINDVIPYISKADEIHLVLCRTGMPSSILNELKWVNKYIKFKLIAKNDKIATNLSSLKFSEIIIDETIDFNYIGIKGKDNLFLVLDNEIVSVDDSFERVFFENKKLVEKIDYDGINEIYIIESQEKKELVNFALEAKKKGIAVTYICDKNMFSKDIFEAYSKICCRLLVAKSCCSTIFVVGKNISSYVYERNNFIPVEFSSLEAVVDEIFLSVNKELGKITKDKEIYTCLNGELSRLNISENMNINQQIKLDSYEDFNEENFDKSTIEKYNDYSNKTKQVTYNFELVPPIIDSSYLISSVYDKTFSYCEEWMTFIKKSSVKDFNKKLQNIDNDNDFLKILDKIAEIEELLLFVYSIKNETYKCRKNLKDYHNTLIKFVEDMKNFIGNFDDNCKSIYSKLSSQNSSIKFNKFDDEILDYQKIIEEKKSLIEKGVDVLSNKRRVEILNKKIDDLRKLKSGFEEKNSLVNDKSSEVFLEKCKVFINNNKKLSDETLSIKNVLKVNELEKTIKLENLFSQYLKDFYEAIVFTYDVLKELGLQDFPENYLLFEKDKKQYIVIENENEYKETKYIQKKYDLLCLVRR